MRTITRAIIHCAATRPSQNIGANEIDAWHRNRGFARIGYHYVIRRSGVVEVGRALEDVGAHAVNYNATSIGVCLAGGLNEQGRPAPEYTQYQWESLKRMVNNLRAQFPGIDVCGHRDLPGVAKACPSFDVRAWLATGEIRA